MLRSLPDRLKKEWFKTLTSEELAALNYDWTFWGREDQQPPPGDWNIWIALAGRGWGKSRTGAEFVRHLIDCGYGRLALVAETAADARDVMVEGESGILKTSPPWNRPKYEPSKRRLTWPNGAIATTYSGDDPEQLRGPQHDGGWLDELAKFRYADDAWANLQFGMRLGKHPRQFISTTPRPIKLLKQLVARHGDGSTIVTRGRTDDNLVNLAPTFRSIIEQYRGTRLGRQELDAEILEDVTGALWNRATLDAGRVKQAPELARVVVAIDPPATSGEDADECGIVVAGRTGDWQGYVLEDLSAGGLTPEKWARRALHAFHKHKASAIVAEVNNGGEMVAAVVRQVDPTVPVKEVRATRGKYLRAEPVALLYEQGRAHHVGAFTALEDQLCNFTVDGMADGSSPDRLDALVWAMTELMIRPRSTGLGIG